MDAEGLVAAFRSADNATRRAAEEVIFGMRKARDPVLPTSLLHVRGRAAPRARFFAGAHPPLTHPAGRGRQRQRHGAVVRHQLRQRQHL